MCGIFRSLLLAVTCSGDVLPELAGKFSVDSFVGPGRV